MNEINNISRSPVKEIIIFFFNLTTLFISCNENNTPELPTTVTIEQKPLLLEPANNANSGNSTPLLVWKSLENAAAYRIQVSLDANFAGIMIADSLTSDTLLQLTQQSYFGCYYYWRVRGLFNNGQSDWSDVWRFRLLLNPPAPPLLLSPPDNSVIQTFIPQFNWSASQGAESYRIQISRNNLFTQVVLDSSKIPLLYLTCPELVLTSGTEYFWRMNASNSNGFSTGNWSSIFSFSTPPGTSPFTISGKIRFADTNFINNEYRIFLFSKWIYPTYVEPVSFISINIDTLINNECRYTFNSVRSGNYYLAVGVGKFLPSQTAILGIYGCDTIHLPYSTCPLNPPGVAIIQGYGVENINFLSWADTSKRIF